MLISVNKGTLISESSILRITGYEGYILIKLSDGEHVRVNEEFDVFCSKWRHIVRKPTGGY